MKRLATCGFLAATVATLVATVAVLLWMIRARPLSLSAEEVETLHVALDATTLGRLANRDDGQTVEF